MQCAQGARGCNAEKSRKRHQNAASSQHEWHGPQGIARSCCQSEAPRAKKLQCQFTIGIEEDSKFRVVRRILGSQGQNMRTIFNETGAKLRLRGRGSKFLEGPEEKESLDDLMLCISSQDEEGYETCLQMVQKLLKRIYREYEIFCTKAGQTVPRLEIQLHEGHRE